VALEVVRVSFGAKILFAVAPTRLEAERFFTALRIDVRADIMTPRIELRKEFAWRNL